VITTLHGTDITLLGSDRSYSEIVAFSIQESDGVTAVSESLRNDTYRELGVKIDIRVIPNFIDCSVYQRRDVAAVKASLAPNGEPILIHVSNFRPVKRVQTVIELFAQVRAERPARLLMVGDGPELADASRLARSLGLGDDVKFLGEQDQIVPLLSASDVFLLPSSQESFGLAALEAMACEVPVVATNIGGLPELIADGRTGFLHAPDDVNGMAASTLRLITDRELHDRMAKAARHAAKTRFCDDKIIPMYEHLYQETLQPV
jgi:N-acetyl-alpha-D-glucosaminyl L-malate synthase BshA